MAVCNRCHGTGKVRGRKGKTVLTHETFYYDETCPKCGGTGVYEPQRGPMGTGYSQSSTPGGGAHRSLYRRDRDDHISWNTDHDGNYISGSGHRDVNGKKSGRNW